MAKKDAEKLGKFIAKNAHKVGHIESQRHKLDRLSAFILSNAKIEPPKKDRISAAYISDISTKM